MLEDGIEKLAGSSSLDYGLEIELTELTSAWRRGHEDGGSDVACLMSSVCELGMIGHIFLLFRRKEPAFTENKTFFPV